MVLSGLEIEIQPCVEYKVIGFAVHRGANGAGSWTYYKEMNGNYFSIMDRNIYPVDQENFEELLTHSSWVLLKKKEAREEEREEAREEEKEREKK